MMRLVDNDKVVVGRKQREACLVSVILALPRGSRR